MPGIQRELQALVRCDQRFLRCDQFPLPGNAAERLGWNGHRGDSSVA